jgi:hypothetical protein
MAFMERLRAAHGPLKTVTAASSAVDGIRDDEARRNLEALYLDRPESGEPPLARDPAPAHAMLQTTRQAWELTGKEIDGIGRETAPLASSAPAAHPVARMRAASRQAYRLQR